MPTPFKIKAALDCSAVTIYDEDEEEGEEQDNELPELTLEADEQTVIAANNSVSPDADSNESLEAHFATCTSEFPEFPEIPSEGKPLRKKSFIQICFKSILVRHSQQTPSSD